MLDIEVEIEIHFQNGGRRYLGRWFEALLDA
jgi:hypothetical protein